MSLNGRSLDIYLDGKLVRTCVLEGVPRVDPKANIQLTPQGQGFDGFVSKFQFVSDSVNPQQAYNIYKKGYKYQKAGIIFSNLKDRNSYDKNLFSTIGNEKKREKLMKAIDYTNIKYGRNALSIAQAGLKKKWNIKRQHSSKIDTACFDFLPTVKIA